MTLDSKYNPNQIEDKWYNKWLDDNCFKSLPNSKKEPYTIVIPPPNVTGVLHMGHMLNNSIQDILTRRARMKGKEACWVPGTDHASIATEAKVVEMLKEKGIDKSSLTRDEFLKYAWEWKEKYGGIILEQLKKLGASCDWSRTKFTMDEDLSKSVIKVFIDLYDKGHIYRGIRMVNWDPQGKTALADDEVIYKEVDSNLYYINYKIKDSKDHLTIATTRPETLLGDTGVCINPNDKRFKHLRNKSAIVPLVEREVPIIFDEYVDMEFGTGCLKVTPSHDENDYKLSEKHNLSSIDIFDDEGKINKNGILYVGKDRFRVRKQIIKDLKKIGQLSKIENHKNKVGYSERTDAVVEPKISTQWFLSMKEIKIPALDNVMNDNIKFHPKKLKNMYRAWMENINDWCISRQLWWGHQIPAYYLPSGEFVVAETKEKAYIKAKEIDGKIKIDELIQDEDVLDTWFSSWLWPISVFDGINNPKNKEINYYYPTTDLVTAPEIIFFWVARMIISGYEYRNEMPFKNVYFTGIVRDKKRRKMSKSLGNSPDPIELMKKYGADGVRAGMLFSAPAGNDLLFDEKLCEQGRNFSNKLWNAFRLIKNFEISSKGSDQSLAISWINSRFNEVLDQVEDHFSKYRISDALLSLYTFIWDDFCSWYLEIIKEKSISKNTYDETIAILEKILKTLHPFMPFITEELWNQINNKRDYVMISDYPSSGKFDIKLNEDFNKIFEIVTGLRKLKSDNKIKQIDIVKVLVNKKSNFDFNLYKGLIEKLSKTKDLEIIKDIPAKFPTLISGKDTLCLAIEKSTDSKEDTLKQIEYLKGFLKSVEKKLSNKSFVDNAPKNVVDIEKKKRDDALVKLENLKKSI
ncbi:MAG: valine--tRNA ligase [Cytophagia bacterium]|nr:valine--tRNA ligase [Cytophagia bacterium]|tara:strand:+ start:5717 stop:8296 length:2580 start_codon:yes stop_codon:yes gene_type:complete